MFREKLFTIAPTDTGRKDSPYYGMSSEMPPLPPVQLHLEACGYRVVRSPTLSLAWRIRFIREDKDRYQPVVDQSPLAFSLHLPRVFSLPGECDIRFFAPNFRDHHIYEWCQPHKVEDYQISDHHNQYRYNIPSAGEALVLFYEKNPKKGGIVIATVAPRVCCGDCQEVLPQSFCPQSWVPLDFGHVLDKGNKCAKCGSQNLVFDKRPPFPIYAAVHSFFQKDVGRDQVGLNGQDKALADLANIQTFLRDTNPFRFWKRI